MAQDSRLTDFANHLGLRRAAILERWRRAVETDPSLTSASALTRTQFYDHIPAVLDGLERELRSEPPSEHAQAEKEQKETAAEHGLHRWHHGYDQQEVMREWSHLYFCLMDELEEYASSAGEFDTRSMRRVHRIVARCFSDGVIESAARYCRLQQIEAAERVRDLEQALAQLEELERRRAEMWREAAHDLRGNLGVVKNATATLNYKDAPEPVRDQSLQILQKSVASLHALLDDMVVLSRLEAGHERRDLAKIDAAVLLKELCAGLQSSARERGLFLHVEGPSTLIVEGDAVKISRIAQNLLLNAIKYTEKGGVKLKWTDFDSEGLQKWALIVQDTGPGFEIARVRPLARALKRATEESRSVEQQAGQPSSEPKPGMLAAKSAGISTDQPAGEGIGLSIVKRLCELLDATVEVETALGKGTTFQIVFPRRYDTR
ncbi:MAG TPA: sensor histidine kinase [Candidatus Eisenbacteria bacterium]|nr:sensor histidine kinase [Candidatus Eisenbacteria bacterium]